MSAARGYRGSIPRSTPSFMWFVLSITNNCSTSLAKGRRMPTPPIDMKCQDLMHKKEGAQAPNWAAAIQHPEKGTVYLCNSCAANLMEKRDRFKRSQQKSA